MSYRVATGTFGHALRICERVDKQKLVPSLTHLKLKLLLGARATSSCITVLA
jgi:hypothetical protein